MSQLKAEEEKSRRKSDALLDEKIQSIKDVELLNSQLSELQRELELLKAESTMKTIKI